MRQVFEGIKVADFSWSVAGPVVTKCLADHGATVVRIESMTHLDPIRTTRPYKDNIPGINRAGFYDSYNNNKYGITLNLNHPKGIEIAERIVAWADVVAESYIPGTMEKWGLGYEELCKINPDIIMFSTCNQGQTGPHAHQRGFGYQLTSLAGLVHLTGWPDRGPSMISVAYTNVVSQYFGVTALVAALDYCHRTGKGQHIDLSQYETGLQFSSPTLLDYIVNGHIVSRTGNRCDYGAPHAVYPCKGRERWCAIAVFSDEEWGGLCQAMGNPEWSSDSKFGTLSARKENEDELDNLIAGWTRKFSAEEVMEVIQANGVAAGVVSNCQDVYANPQLKYREHFRELDHAEIGRHYYEAPAFALSKTPAQLDMPSPCLGEHSHYFYNEILGMASEEFVELLNEGIFE